MEDVFVQALANRAKQDSTLLEKLDADVAEKVAEKLAETVTE